MPRYAADHQMAVIDCLEDPDETLKRKTVCLIYREFFCAFDTVMKIVGSPFPNDQLCECRVYR